MVITDTIQEAIMKFKQQITAKFKCKILNMEITHTVEGGLFLSQSLYMKDMLEKFKQYLPETGSKFNGAKTPTDNKIRLHKERSTQLRFRQKEIEMERESVKCDANIPFREVVGSLLWLTNVSRPVILFAVNQVAKYCCDPRTANCNACKRILRYLPSTQDYVILYSPESYVDADFANRSDDRRSISGYAFLLAGGHIKVTGGILSSDFTEGGQKGL